MTTHTTHRVLYTAYGTPTPAPVETIERAEYWVLRNPEYPRVTLYIENCPAKLKKLRDYLFAGWQLVNDTQSITGYAAPATTDAANDAHSDHENGNEDSHVSK